VLPVEDLRPELEAVEGVQQLGRDPEPAAVFSNAALEQGTDIETPADLPGVYGSARELKRG